MVGITFDTATTSLASLCITHAENEINKYLSKRYDLSSFSTSTSVPPLVSSLCETLSEGYIYRRMGRSDKNMMAHSKELVNQVTDNLKMISDYKLDLVDSSGTPIVDMSNTAYRCLSSTDTYSTTFDEDSELNWKIDTDKLDDIESGRD